MKQTHFNPALIGVTNSKPNYLPRFTSRRFPGASRHGSSCYKEQGGDPDPDGKKEALLKDVRTAVADELQKRGAEKETIAGIVAFTDQFKQIPLESLRELANEEKGAMALIATYGQKLEQLRTDMEAKRNPEDFSIRAQAAEFLKKNESIITQIRAGQKQALNNLPTFELNLRAVNNPMLPANVMPSGSLFITKMTQEAMSAVQAPIPTFWDLLNKPRTGAETIVWVNKKAYEGAAAFIAPGVYKPNISFTFDTDISNAKKVAASEKMATELLQDIDNFTTFVEQDLQNAVLMEANKRTTTGVLSSTVPAGIRTLSVTFAGPTLGIRTVNPNYYDVIKAAETQLLSQPRFARRRIVTLINPIDRANMEMTKATTQGQLFVPFTLRSTLVEDPDIPVGYFQCAVLDAYNVRIYKPYSIAWGYENDDFTKNLVTAIGEMRIHQFVKDADAGAFIYDTFANVIDGIEDPQD